MFKDNRYINAGTNELYRWGKKAVDKLHKYLEPNENGYYSIPADGGKYWTFGTSEGKYGEFARYGDVIFSVNKGGFLYAKAGTDKGDAFLDMLLYMLSSMYDKQKQNPADAGDDGEDEEEEDN